MGTDFIGKAVAPTGRQRLYTAKINSAGLLEGAAVVYDTGNGVKAPGGDAALAFAGLIADVLGASGTVSGHDVNLQRDGIGRGLLKASQAITRGAPLVIAGTDGSLRAFADDTDTEAEIIGLSEDAKTAGAGGPEPIRVNLDFTARIDTV